MLASAQICNGYFLPCINFLKGDTKYIIYLLTLQPYISHKCERINTIVLAL